jgi:hypothetical protein
VRLVGGPASLLYGNMACGVRAQDLIVPVAADQVDAALAESGTRPFELTSADEGRPLVNRDRHADLPQRWRRDAVHADQPDRHPARLHVPPLTAGDS